MGPTGRGTSPFLTIPRPHVPPGTPVWEVRREALWDSWPDSMALHVGPKSCEGKGRPESSAASQMQSRRLVLGHACPCLCVGVGALTLWGLRCSIKQLHQGWTTMSAGLPCRSYQNPTMSSHSTYKTWVTYQWASLVAQTVKNLPAKCQPRTRITKMSRNIPVGLIQNKTFVIP